MSNRLFVGNLSFNTTEDELQSAFAQFGEVSEVKIVTDRDTGRPRGFAFIEMSSDEAARKAIDQMNGTMLDGRALRVSEAENRRDRGPGGGGGGGGGRGDFSRPRNNDRSGRGRGPRW